MKYKLQTENLRNNTYKETSDNTTNRLYIHIQAKI